MINTADYNKKLLVEGRDDKHVVMALCKNYNISENFNIVDCEGIDNLLTRDYISAWFKKSGIKTIGIIIDADINGQARWNSLFYTLTSIGFRIPNIFPVSGLIIDNGTQKVGVWLMPDNNSKGMLEDFISFLIPIEDKLLPFVEDALTEIEKQELNKYSKEHRSKAKIHTWLAWQEDPGTPLGLSITRKYLSTDEEICQKFVKWLSELFK